MRSTTLADHPAGISHRRRVSGVGHWRWQRYSAVLLLLLMAYLVILTAGLGTLDHAAATALVGQPVNALALAVLVSVGMWHGTLGLQVVIEDYVSVGAGRHAVLGIARVAMGLIAAGSLWAIARIAF